MCLGGAGLGRSTRSGAVKVLSLQGWEMWAMVSKFGLCHGSVTIQFSLQGVRRADGNIQRRAGVCRSRGDHVCKSYLSAWNEAMDLRLNRTITYEVGHSDVATGGLAQSATSGVHSTSGSSAHQSKSVNSSASSTDSGDRARCGHCFPAPGPACPQPKTLTLIHLQKALANTFVNACSDDCLAPSCVLRANGRPSSPSPSSRVMLLLGRSVGAKRSCSALPSSTFCNRSSHSACTSLCRATSSWPNPAHHQPTTRHMRPFMRRVMRSEPAYCSSRAERHDGHSRCTWCLCQLLRAANCRLPFRARTLLP